ncbi:MBL fold metallo-hydrolase [Amycolatopsis pithecellobii]|uniref:MBL fold metallo-hydrolase n=1 Tax=Amycolatopsis pithecellobii TaxID=664692 RepID=A0A6N7Z4D7_9PSEU|nr:MBL fold metallo-hydrolase [Amycolatopsis pithecellobii]MTD55174.1 MBL fold metallo-hydrolase [Amycolatopsis pithecellobii]
MAWVPYSRGLHHVAEGCWAWLEPPGTWGMSNSGLVTIGGETLVVDTQIDPPRARALRAAATGVAEEITTVVNTHDDGDHWFGNLVFEDARILATTAASDAMRTMPMDPRRLGEIGGEGTALRRWSQWRAEVYDYEGWRPAYPTETFDGSLTVKLGDGTVELHEVGPAHTRGDAIVHVPAAGVVFTGDILFHRATPIVWAGPVSNHIAACDVVLGLDAAVVVPGHGPVASGAAVRETRNYLVHLLEHTLRHVEAGAPPEVAYRTFDPGEYRLWPHTSRAFPTIQAIYAEHRPDLAGLSWAETMEIVLAGDAE